MMYYWEFYEAKNGLLVVVVLVLVRREGVCCRF